MENIAYIKIFPDGSWRLFWIFFVERTKSPVAKNSHFFDNDSHRINSGLPADIK